MAFDLGLAQFFLGFAHARALGLKLRLLLLEQFSHLLSLGALGLWLRSDWRGRGSDDDRCRLERLLLPRRQRNCKRFQLLQDRLELGILRRRNDWRDDWLRHDNRLRLLYGSLLDRNLVRPLAKRHVEQTI